MESTTTTTMTSSSNTKDPLAARELPTAINTPELIAEHERVVQGCVRTRFPPEPNGYLHIGHAKSLYMNFHGAFEKLGTPQDKRMTIFRYDDTNPEAESQEYIDSIAEFVRWLGWEPAVTTFSSDYFDWLVEQGIELIKRGKAYVCHQTGDEISACREIAFKQATNPDYPGISESPWRNRSVEDNLRLFADMRKGKFGEGEASLRMKINMKSTNPNEYDPIAFRIMFVAHPHVGDKYCCYPTYDFTHCLIDSKEHIDYSICTLEFENRRETYYWLLDALDLYRPKVYEFARLDMTYCVMSKRKIKKLVETKTVRGWDDPRLSTLAGMRRRGYTPKIINQFCADIGITRNFSTVEIERFFSVVDSILDEDAPRGFAVVHPLKVILENFPDDKTEEVQIPNFPKKPELGTHMVYLSKVVYIDHDNFRLVDDADFKGLAPGKWCILKGTYWIQCTEVIFEDSDKTKIKELRANYSQTVEQKPKNFGALHWVSSKAGEEPIKAELRLYDNLFSVPNPPDADWEKYLNPSSLVVVENAFVDHFVADPSRETLSHLQFERVGYFCLDPDTVPGKSLVYNRTLPLKTSYFPPAEKEKEEAKKLQRAQKLAQLAERERLSKIDPKTMFLGMTDLYSKFDPDTGLPTHNVNGEPLTKSAMKTLKKQQEKQEKIYKPAAAAATSATTSVEKEEEGEAEE